LKIRSDDDRKTNNRGRLPVRHKMPIDTDCLCNLNNILHNCMKKKKKAEYKLKYNKSYLIFLLTNLIIFIDI